IERGELVHDDVGVRNRDLFLCQESFGLLVDIQSTAEASANRPRARWRRGLAYYQTAMRYLRETPLTPLRVSVDGRMIARDAVIVTVANVETYGPWLPLTPDASPIDGLLDVFVMRRSSKRAILAALVQRHLRLAAGTPHALGCRGGALERAEAGRDVERREAHRGPERFDDRRADQRRGQPEAVEDEERLHGAEQPPDEVERHGRDEPPPPVAIEAAQRLVELLD